jgi:hypothetical protein
MNQMQQAVIDVLKEQTQPIKRSNLIAAVYQKAKQHLTEHHLNPLLKSNKIEKSGFGKYQIVNNQN